MPLTVTEARVLDLWDDGHHARDIARISGIAFARVAQVIETYHDRGTRQHRTHMTSASAALRDAILAQTRPVAAWPKSLIWNKRSLAEADSQRGALA